MTTIILDTTALLDDLKRLTKEIKADLRERAEAVAEVGDGLRAAHRAIVAGGRTAKPFETWRDDYLEQVAVAWVLACVFVRYLEDNDLIEETYLAGVDDRRRQAEEAYHVFFQAHPHDTDRDYLLDVFRRVRCLKAVADLYAEGKTPIWAVGPSGDGAKRLLRFWQEIDPATGGLVRSFRAAGPIGRPGRVGFSLPSSRHDEPGDGRLKPTLQGDEEIVDTRFLGDLYQDLSEAARKKYALLQTPEFVEEFILDHTLTPALDEFGLEKVRLIDPTCGSGHFLLGAFRRLFRLWDGREPNTERALLAQRALDAVCGVDVNPMAVAIARFRLIVEAMHACEIRHLKDAPGWRVHVVFGDSLMHGDKFDRRGFSQEWLPNNEPWADPVYAIEDPEGLRHLLSRQYHIVVGNPPYITVKDAKINERYRSRWGTCHRQYSMGVPFTERFFNLALAQDETRPAGYVGMITANSFMKREFGKKLIEEFLPEYDLTHVIDTSGAYIPGHGTPTVILFGRNRRPVGDEVRAVLGIRGEPTTPDDPAHGLVWRSIVDHLGNGRTQNEFVSIGDLQRERFRNHPWSVGGGGASELRAMMEEVAETTLGELASAIGRTTVVGEDDAWILDDASAHRHKVADLCVPFGIGECLRDWGAEELPRVIYPYESLGGNPVPPTTYLVTGYLWIYRTLLRRRTVFGKSLANQGRPWYEHLEHYTDKLRWPLSIVVAFVATHNHFVLDRGVKVFNRSAPIIKLSADATEDEHLALLGLLNSSTACFWMKQVFHSKGSQGINEGLKAEYWEQFFEFSGTGVGGYLVVDSRAKVLPLVREIDALAREIVQLSPAELVKREVPTGPALEANRREKERLRARMVALQEELDWLCYRLYGLLDADDPAVGHPDTWAQVPGLALGQHHFEIVLARQVAAGEVQTAWFERHGSTPITEIPDAPGAPVGYASACHPETEGDEGRRSQGRHAEAYPTGAPGATDSDGSHGWPEWYRERVARRIERIEIDPNIGLIERPEYKRRWLREPWDEQVRRALRSWLLDRLESGRYWPDPAHAQPELVSCAALANVAAQDAEFQQVASLYAGRPDFDLARLVEDLIASESVPFLPVLRYKPSGLTRRRVWERTWDLQRREDSGEDVGTIPVPPKYTSADFQAGDIWRLRGKLDVPKERCVSYPHGERDGDPSLVVGWAGWDHLRQAQALAAYYDRMKTREGWPPERLVPLLAGLDQLVPWLIQWYNEVDPEYDLRMGNYYRDFVRDEAQGLGYTLEQVRGWEPPAKARGGRRRKSS